MSELVTVRTVGELRQLLDDFPGYFPIEDWCGNNAAHVYEEDGVVIFTFFVDYGN